MFRVALLAGRARPRDPAGRRPAGRAHAGPEAAAACSSGTASSTASRCRPGNYMLEAAAEDEAGNRAKPYPFAVVTVRYVALGRTRDHRAAGHGLRAPRAHRRAGRDVAARRPARRVPLPHAPPARAEEARRVPALRRGVGARGEGDRGRRVIAELARAGGAVGALGLALLILGTGRATRLAGLVRVGRRLRVARASGSLLPATTAPTPRRPSSEPPAPCCSRGLLRPLSLADRGRGARLRTRADPGLGRLDEGEPAAADLLRRRRGRARARVGDSSATERPRA